MKCRQIQNLLYDYTKKDLDAVLQREIDRHVKTCPACSRELSNVKKYHAMITSVKQVEPPGDFIYKTMHRIESDSSLKNFIHAIFMPFRIKIPLEAAGLLLISIIVFNLYKPQNVIEQIAPVSPVMRSTFISKAQVKRNERILVDNQTTPQKAFYDKELNESSKTADETIIAGEPAQKADRDASGKAYRAKEESLNNQIAVIILTVERNRIMNQSSSINENSTNGKSKSSFLSMPKNKVHAGAMQQPSAADEPSIIKDIKKVIAADQGKILNVSVNKQNGSIESIIVELPGRNYQLFMEHLKNIVPAQGVTLNQTDAKQLEKIQLNILIRERK